jgi:predicted acetyltransferase
MDASRQQTPLTVLVDDDFLTTNSGLYTLDFGEQENRVQFEPMASDQQTMSQVKADLRVSARVLATLLLGCNSLADLEQLPEITIDPDLSVERLNWLHGLFAGKENAIYDYF